MDITAIVAIYGAATGTVALYLQHQSQRTRVKVELTVGTHVALDRTERKTVHLRVVNHSGHPVRIESIGLESKRSKNDATNPGLVSAKIDLTAHGGAHLDSFHPAQLTQFRFIEGEPVRAWANLESGRMKRSKWLPYEEWKRALT